MTISLSSGNDTFYIYENFLGGSSSRTLTDVNLQTIDGGAGTDTVQMGDSYPNNNFTLTVSDVGVVTLTAASGHTTFQNFEVFRYSNNIVLAVGSAGDDSVSGGSGNDPGLYGLAGNDTLNGGTGGDVMLGGAGNDTYVVDSVQDSVQETTTRNGSIDAGGADSVQSAIAYTLGNFVENLLLTGAAAINGAGNALNNTVSGNEANNALAGNDGNDQLNGAGGNDTLDGGAGVDRLDGGTGNDVLLGGAGNDTYVVDSAADAVYETTTVGGATNAGGKDLVLSSVSFTLGSFVDNLTLSGTAAIDGTGNTLGNRLFGNAAANQLAGVGGKDVLNGGGGSDLLAGGAGADVFQFSSPLGAGNVDTISDWGSVDHIQLDDDVFTALGPVTATTALDPALFFTGAAAHDADDRIVYQRSTGALYYDPDGNGPAAQLQFAQVGTTTHPALDAGAFQVIV